MCTAQGLPRLLCPPPQVSLGGQEGLLSRRDPAVGNGCRLWPPLLVPALGVPSQAALATSLTTAPFPLRERGIGITCLV